jgi:hypothetical protein
VRYLLRGTDRGEVGEREAGLELLQVARVHVAAQQEQRRHGGQAQGLGQQRGVGGDEDLRRGVGGFPPRGAGQGVVGRSGGAGLERALLHRDPAHRLVHAHLTQGAGRRFPGLRRALEREMKRGIRWEARSGM